MERSTTTILHLNLEQIGIQNSIAYISNFAAIRQKQQTKRLVDRTKAHIIQQQKSPINKETEPNLLERERERE